MRNGFRERRPVGRRYRWVASLAVVLGVVLGSEAQGQDAAPFAGYTLEECIQLGMQRQPALNAARASLAAAESGSRSLENLRFAGLIARDLPVRRQQACLGIQIAQANLFQSEWETRYAITRNYYSVIFARQQEEVAKNVKRKIADSLKKAKDLLKVGDPNIPITQIDVDSLGIAQAMVESKSFEATVGLNRGLAALREAMGLGPNDPLAVAENELPALRDDLSKDELVAQALALRGELTQAALAQQVTQLEIDAQGRVCFKRQVGTFASASDVHAKPIPTGVANTEYRPGAIGLEMPPFLIGKRNDRMDRASDLNDRALSVVEKTQILITLEVEAAYYKWFENAQRLKVLVHQPAKAASVYKSVKDRFDQGKVSGEELLRAQTLEDQVQAEYNTALYNHALGLAALERVTAGAFRLRP